MAEDKDFSDTEAIEKELGALLAEKTKNVFPPKFRRFLKPIIPDPNQLSIPSEPTVRGTFVDRLPSPRRTFDSFMVEQRTKEKGNKIVLNSILDQLDSFPSLRGPEDEFAFPGLDIFFSELFKKPGSLVTPEIKDLDELIQRLKEFNEGGVKT